MTDVMELNDFRMSQWKLVLFLVCGQNLERNKYLSTYLLARGLIFVVRIE